MKKKRHAKKKRLPKRPKKAPRKKRPSKRKSPTTRGIRKNSKRKSGASKKRISKLVRRSRTRAVRRTSRRKPQKVQRTSYAEHLNEYAGSYPNGRPKYRKLIENFEKRVVFHKPPIQLTEDNIQSLYNKSLRFLKNKKSKTPIRKIEMYWILKLKVKDNPEPVFFTVAYAAPVDEHMEYFLEQVMRHVSHYKKLYLTKETTKYSFATKTKRVRGGFRATQKKHKARKKAKNRNVRHRGK